MFDSINKKFNEEKEKVADNNLIIESVVGDGEVLPMSDEEIDGIIDTDSIEEDDLEDMDKAIEDLIEKEDFNDEEIEELLDDDGEEE